MWRYLTFNWAAKDSRFALVAGDNARHWILLRGFYGYLDKIKHHGSRGFWVRLE
jgi:hypothetical protein